MVLQPNPFAGWHFLQRKRIKQPKPRSVVPQPRLFATSHARPFGCSDLRQCTVHELRRRWATCCFRGISAGENHSLASPSLYTLPFLPNIFLQALAIAFLPDMKGLVLDGNLCQTLLGTRRSTPVSLRSLGGGGVVDLQVALFVFLLPIL